MLCGHRYSITLYTPGKPDQLTPSDWGSLSRLGFPVYLYDVASIQIQVVPNGGFADGGFSTSAVGTDIARDH